MKQGESASESLISFPALAAKLIACYFWQQFMGIADRDYGRFPSGHHSSSYGAPPGRLAGCPVTKWLMISNIAIFFIDIFTNRILSGLGHFSVGYGIEQMQLWRLLTFQFLHVDGMHLLFNMFGLYMLGPFVEPYWQSKRYLVFYLLCGIAGVVLYMIIFYAGWFGSSAYRPLVGASAGVYGIFVCAAAIAPNIKVLFMFFIPMTMRQLALLLLTVSVVIILFNLSNAGGEAGHLGGVILGFILTKNPRLLAFIKPRLGSSRQKSARKKRQKMKPRIEINMDDTEVDRILDKVSKEGVQSLTEAEKETLKRSAGK